MKILIPQNFYAPNAFGGAERSVQLLAEALCTEGHEVHVACLALEEPRGTRVINGENVHYLSIDHPGEAPGNSRRRLTGRALWQISSELSPKVRRCLKPLVRELAPDLIHTHNLAGLSVSVWQLIRELGLPLIHTLMGLYLLCPKGTMLRGTHNCESRCMTCRVFTGRRKTASNLVDLVVGNSQFILDLHRDAGYFCNAVTEVVYSGERFDALDRDRAWHAGGEDLRISYLGRLHPSKGPQVLLEAVKLLPSTGWRLSIGGSGLADYERSLQREHTAERVCFTGWTQTDTFLAGIDVLVVPSLCHDVLPRVVFEAHARGVPVVGARRGGIPEMIEHGSTGWLFEPSRVQTLADRLSRLVADPGLVFACRDECLNSAQRFDNRAITTRYLDIYNRVLAH